MRYFKNFSNENKEKIYIKESIGEKERESMCVLDIN